LRRHGRWKAFDELNGAIGECFDAALEIISLAHGSAHGATRVPSARETRTLKIPQ
jgi:hypothetical protein